MRLKIWWQNLSVLKKLFSVVGVMAILIALELFTLIFAMNTLSSVRAFVGGEALWSKAQKSAVYYLHQYALTENEKFYQLFHEALEVPEGDRKARLELEKPQFKMEVVKEGFIQGKIHPSDIPKMISLVRRFHEVPYLAKAISLWKQGDEKIMNLKDIALRMHNEILKKNSNTDYINQLIDEMTLTDTQSTRLENEFSYSLGVASRWLEDWLMVLLVIAVIAVESTGLYLTYRLGKYLRRFLGQMNEAAIQVGEGNFSRRVKIESKDELGQLAQSLNKMAQNLENQIFERKNAEHASQAKNLFLANMSHEIRTPLNAILGFAEILQDPQLQDKDKIRYTSIIKRTGESLNTIINDVLDMSKIEAEKIEIQKEKFSLTQLLADLYAVMRLRCNEKGIQLIFEKTGEISEYIISDQTRLRQILTNMLGNSIKFTEKGEVKLIYEVRGTALYFTIIDTGAGISLDQKDNLFKPFSQGDLSSSKKYGGTGLGLTIAQKLARLLGGNAELVSSKEGQGSQFLIHVEYTPVERSEDQGSQGQSNLEVRAKNIQNKKILVVEDSLDNQMLIEFHLVKYGASVDFANNGEEGVQKALGKNYDLILMDMQMPIKDGYMATKELREKNKNKRCCC